MTNVTSTAFKKGEKKPGQGRPKGCLNKNNQMIRDMITEALHGVGGVDYLMDCATDPKTKAAFLGLIGKVMPVQLAGDPDNPIKAAITLEITGVPTTKG